MFNGLRRAFGRFKSRLATKELSERDLEDALWELHLSLVANNVAFDAAEQIVNDIKAELVGLQVKRFSKVDQIVLEAAREAIYRILTKPGRYDLLKEVRGKMVRGRPFVTLFVGVNGGGKTTTIAKIAYMLKKNGLKSVIACSDTFRAGAIEQVEEHARRIGVDVVKHRYGASPAAVAFDAVAHANSRRIPVVLIDTAGRMQTNKDLMDEMRKIHRVVEPDATIFVGDALAGNDALDQAKMFSEAVPLTGSILTKVDADEKGGTAISIVYATERPLIYLGVGQGYEDLVPADPEWIVARVLGLS